MEGRPKIPFENVLAGQILYWVCIIGSWFAMIGPIISLLFPEKNTMDVYRAFDLVWAGKNPDEIWNVLLSGGKFPGPHFWIHSLPNGDAITQLGLWLGCSCALFSTFITGIVYLFKKDFLYFLMCMWSSFMIFFAMLGIISMH